MLECELYDYEFPKPKMVLVKNEIMHVYLFVDNDERLSLG